MVSINVLIGFLVYKDILYYLKYERDYLKWIYNFN